MYTEIEALLDTLEQRRKMPYFLGVLALCVISFFISLQLSDDPARSLVEKENIILNTDNVPKTGENHSNFYIFFSDSYMEIPKDNNCPNFSNTDFFTWCNPYNIPKKY